MTSIHGMRKWTVVYPDICVWPILLPRGSTALHSTARWSIISSHYRVILQHIRIKKYKFCDLPFRRTCGGGFLLSLLTTLVWGHFKRFFSWRWGTSLWASSVASNRLVVRQIINIRCVAASLPTILLGGLRSLLWCAFATFLSLHVGPASLAVGLAPPWHVVRLLYTSAVETYLENKWNGSLQICHTL